MTPPFDGVDRRGGITMEALAARLDAIKDALDKVESRLERLEESTHTNCRDCKTWERIATLEKQQARSQGIAVGVSTAIGAAWAFVSHIWK